MVNVRNPITIVPHLPICFGIAMLSLLAGCEFGGPDQAPGQDKKIFRYNQAGSISSLDPAFAKDQANIWAVHQLYNGLLQLDAELKIRPCLARRWEVSDDGLVYTFHLRSDAYFHDSEAFADGKGRLVRAADVAYSLNRIIDPAVASPGAWIFRSHVAESAPFRALDDSTFALHLRRPFRPMLSILTMQYCSILPREAVEHFGEAFRANPVGTGPFVFRNWQEGTSLLMLRNETYFESDGAKALPYLDGVRVSFIENKKTVYLKFITGDLDFISGLDGSYLNEVLTKDGALHPDLADQVRLYKRPYLNTEYLGFLMDDSKLGLDANPLRDARIRKAINYGFDRHKMIAYLRNSIGIPATSGFIPQGLPAFDAEAVPGYTYDPERAKRLLAEAGYPNGEGLSAITLMTNGAYENVGVFIANQLGEIGLEVELELSPPAFLRERMAKSEAPFFRGSWIADYPDAESYLAMFYGGNAAPPNYTRFSNEAFDELYEQALNTQEDNTRLELYRAMDRIIVEDAPVVPLYYDEVVRFVANGIEGMEPNALNLLELKRVRIN